MRWRHVIAHRCRIDPFSTKDIRRHIPTPAKKMNAERLNARIKFDGAYALRTRSSTSLLSASNGVSGSTATGDMGGLQGQAKAQH